MSPTSLTPGASALKSRATRSGVGPRPGLARDQTQLTHDRPDQLQAARLALAGQLGVHPAVTVGLVGHLEDRLDEHAQVRAAPGGGRGRAVAPLVETRRGHRQPDTSSGSGTTPSHRR